MGKKNKTVLESVDEDTRLAILHLNQRLAELQAEISAKLLSMAKDPTTIDETKKDQLIALETEVQQALNSMDAVVNMVVSKETDKDFLENYHQEIDTFRDMVIENAKMIATLKEKKK